MEKAYDRIEWVSLWQALEAFGFPSTWILWIKEYVTNVFYSIKVNGQPSAWFRPSRGLDKVILYHLIYLFYAWKYFFVNYPFKVELGIQGLA